MHLLAVHQRIFTLDVLHSPPTARVSVVLRFGMRWRGLGRLRLLVWIIAPIGHGTTPILVNGSIFTVPYSYDACRNTFLGYYLRLYSSMPKRL